MALVGAGLVRRIVCSQCLLRGSLDHLPVPSAILCWPLKSGAGASMVMAGIVLSTLFLSDSFAGNRRRKTVWALAFAASLFAAAAMLAPLGISKLRATPTYCLFAPPQPSSHSSLSIGFVTCTSESAGGFRKACRLQHSLDVPSSEPVFRSIRKSRSHGTMDYGCQVLSRQLYLPRSSWPPPRSCLG